MKRIFTLALAAAAIGLGAHAQSVYNSGNSTSRFGAEVEWNLNAPVTSFNSPQSIYQNGSGFSVGAFYDIPLYMNLYFEPGLKFFYNTIIIDPELTVEDVLKYDFGAVDGSLRNYGFRIPLKFGYRFVFAPDISLAVVTGPQINIGLGMKMYNNAAEKSTSLYGNGWRRVDAQWLFGIRFTYADNWFADIEGGIGMGNMLTGDRYKGMHFRRNTFAIGVGYLF